MLVKKDALQALARRKKWSLPELAEHLGVDYSYLFRVMNGQKRGGAKLILGILHLCQQEGLETEDFIFLDAALPPDNGHLSKKAAASETHGGADRINGQQNAGKN